MTRRQSKLLLIIITLFALLTAGCDRLRAGYYLTPENYPTARPSQIPSIKPVTLTATPVSTIQQLIVPTITLTPFGATAGPTTTITPTPTETLQPCNETQGQVIEEVFSSQRANHEIHYRVYLPPCYAKTERRYPTLILLHGQSYDDSQWDRLGMPEAADQGYITGSLPPMIIVMPNGNDALLMSDIGPFPEMVVEELIPTIDSRLCTWGEAAYRAIGGLSRGGYWAFWIAFSHPDLFGRVGGHSPYFYQPDYGSDKNIFNIVDIASDVENLAIYIDHGGENREVIEVKPGVEALMARLINRGVLPEYVPHETGDHEESYWSGHVSEYLTFYAANWPRNVLQYPSCHAPNP